MRIDQSNDSLPRSWDRPNDFKKFFGHLIDRGARSSVGLVTALGFSLLLAGCIADADSTDAEKSAHVATTIHNGSEDFSDAPAIARSLVSLRYRDQFTCSGTLVAPNRVLTAAHCVIIKSKSALPNYQVQLFDGQTTTIETIDVHSTADLAVLGIAGSYQPVAPIHTARAGSIKPGDRVVFAGLGTTLRGADSSDVRRWGKFVFRSYAGDYPTEDATGTVRVNYSSGLFFSPDACTSADSACSDACPGDSGGPIFQWRKGEGWGLIGVVSTGGCASSTPGAVAADARAWRSWILEQ